MNLRTKSSSIYAAFFGSSFNVVDRESTLNEVARILMPNGGSHV